jgi:phage terminase small subunit
MTRGRKPKAPHLRLIEGTHRPDRHGTASKARESVATSAANFGPLRRPPYLKRFAREAWKKYIEPATWLDASREPAAIMFCELWQEFRSAPMSFQAARHTQLRGLMSDLGLTDERKRPVADTEKIKDEHFDD